MNDFTTAGLKWYCLLAGLLFGMLQVLKPLSIKDGGDNKLPYEMQITSKHREKQAINLGEFIGLDHYGKYLNLVQEGTPENIWREGV